jgi:hypothetical protein
MSRYGAGFHLESTTWPRYSSRLGVCLLGMLTTNPIAPDWPPVGWLTKKVAAERLNLSESRVAALGGDDRSIHIIMSRHPQYHQNVTLFHEGDVERFAFNRDNPTQVAKIPAKIDKPVVSRELEAILRANQEAFPTRSSRPWNYGF